ncbi:MAG: YerC/YecD family TrpR-related protein [Gammaproteobacteria bacterium]|jgi:TrpR-related protein YerC/YecD
MTKTETSLYQAILQLKTSKECAAFFHDLCTPAEITAMSERWRVAQLLDQERLSYREIYQKTKISLATIGRVARFLTKESYHGYRLILDRLTKGYTHAEK